jgi:hypothetical protein
MRGTDVSNTKQTDVVMAKQISAVVCEHGSLYIRLHDAKGKIFAAACMDRKVGFALINSIVNEFSEPSAECGGVH